MTYYVSVENSTSLRYMATIVGWPNCIAEGATRDEAVERVKERFIEHLNQVEIVPIEVESSNLENISENSSHPWTEFAGVYAENPLFDEVLELIEQDRNAIDTDDLIL